MGDEGGGGGVLEDNGCSWSTNKASSKENIPLYL